MQPNVRVIKAVKNDFNNIINDKKLRVAAYCRVSTNDDDQLNSFESQLNYYKEKISEHKDWEFAEIYSDEAITGTKADIRPGFQKLIRDAVAGKIDFILTKSISRFARNTVDTLNYVRKLKSQNVAICFEEENINTLTMDGELLLTILSSVAQQEVQNISEHVKKGLKMKMQRGEIVGFGRCLGYDYHPETKSLSINIEEARIVKYIFERVASGLSLYKLGKELKELGYKTSRGKTNWSDSSLSDIVKNEKYKGDLLLGKTYTVDPIGKKRVRNDNQSDKFYIENHHEPIVSKELWNSANMQLQIRKERHEANGTKFFVNKYSMSGKIICGYCGSKLVRRSQLQTKYEYKNVWKCKNNIMNGSIECSNSKSIDEAAIKKAFLESLAYLASDSNNYVDEFILNMRKVVGAENPSNLINKYQNDIATLEKKKSRMLDMVLDNMISSEDYQIKKEKIELEIKNITNKMNDVSDLASKKDNIVNRLEEFKKIIKTSDDIMEFNDDLFDILIDRVILGEGDRPNLVNLIFKLSDDKINESNQTFHKILEFECEYDHYSFDTLPSGRKERNLHHSFPVIVSLV